MVRLPLNRRKFTVIIALILATCSLAPTISIGLEERGSKAEITQISLSSESSYLLDVGYMHDTVNAMAYAPNGDLVVAGTLCAVYYLPEDPDTCVLTVDGVEITSDDFAPAFLMTLDPAGNAKDAQIISSPGGDRIDSISFADNGDLLVGGSACWLRATNCTLTGFGISLDVIDGGSDAWFARLGPGGEARWSMMLGSKGFDTIHSITEAPDGSIYIAGTFCQNYNLVCTIAIGDQVHQSNGGADLMIAKLSSQGDVLWSKSFGSGSSDTDMLDSWYSLNQKGIVATPDGGLLVAGYACEGWDANCRMNIDATHFVNNHNSFVVKYDHSGVVERLSVMNGDAADYLQVMVEVDDHRVLLAGNHYSSTLYAGNFSVFNSGGSDAWYAVFNHTSWDYEGLWDSKTDGNEVFHSAAVTSEGHYILGGTQCWGNEGEDCPVTFESSDGMQVTRERNSDQAEGFLMLHNTDWGSIDWMRGILDNGVGASYLSDMAISQAGNIAANFPVCVTGNNTGCSAAVGTDEYSSVENATLIYQITIDADADGIYDAFDLCLASPSAGWVSDLSSDIDGDGCRDSDQDEDDDGDGYPDESDKFPVDPSEWMDTDNDGVGDNADLDDDSDGWSDLMEGDCGGTDPKDPLSLPQDTDEDGECDQIDNDDDADDVVDALDAFPLEICASLDRDLDGMPDEFTIPNCPTSLVLDHDDDNDGVPDMDDIDPLDDKVGADSDGDGKPDWVLPGANSAYVEDTDDDNDGIPDSDDAFPLISTESRDTDNDGIGDNSDTDDDGDGWSDLDELSCETDPFVAADFPSDQDSDGVCDNMETSSVDLGGFAGIAGIAVLLVVLGVVISMVVRRPAMPSSPPSPPPLPKQDDDVA